MILIVLKLNLLYSFFTGTTSACPLKLFRKTIALEKDEEKVVFINMRIKALWECPDQDEEVGAKHIVDTEKFQPASREPIPLLAEEPRELIELDDEVLEDFTMARLSREDNFPTSEFDSIMDEEDDDVHDLIAM